MWVCIYLSLTTHLLITMSGGSNSWSVKICRRLCGSCSKPKTHNKWWNDNCSSSSKSSSSCLSQPPLHTEADLLSKVEVCYCGHRPLRLPSTFYLLLLLLLPLLCFKSNLQHSSSLFMQKFCLINGIALIFQWEVLSFFSEKCWVSSVKCRIPNVSVSNWLVTNKRQVVIVSCQPGSNRSSNLLNSPKILQFFY